MKNNGCHTASVVGLYLFVLYLAVFIDLTYSLLCAVN